MAKHTFEGSPTPDFTKKAADIASEFLLSQNRVETKREIPKFEDVYMNALSIFVSREPGQLTPYEIGFIEYCINQAILNDKDPSDLVVSIASKLNELQERIILKYLDNANALKDEFSKDLNVSASSTESRPLSPSEN